MLGMVIYRITLRRKVPGGGYRAYSRLRSPLSAINNWSGPRKIANEIIPGLTLPFRGGGAARRIFLKRAE